MGALTDLIGPVYQAIPAVNREMTGFIPAINIDSAESYAAEGQRIAVNDIEVSDPIHATPGVNPATPNKEKVDVLDVVINKNATVLVPLDGATEKGMQFTGTRDDVMQKRFASAFRKIVNQIEADVALEAVGGASRAYGTAGNTPFGTAGNLTDFANMAEILDANGCPKDDRAIVVNGAALANLRGVQTILLKSNEAGSQEFLRTGYTAPVLGFKIFDSAGLALHTKGAGTGYQLNMTDSKKGDFILDVDTGNGIIKAGDVITFTGNAVKYVVNKEISAPGELRIGRPGLLATVADNTALTVGNNYTPSVAFHRDAIKLVTRLPSVPQGGDSAEDETVVFDAYSGLYFAVRLYKQYRQSVLEVSIAYGVKTVRPENVATLLG